MLVVPYISPQEFVDAFPDVDVSRYVSSGTQPNASVSLLALTRRASSLADGWCKQQLRATVDSDTLKLYPTKQGTIRVWPKYRPIISVSSLSYKYDFPPSPSTYPYNSSNTWNTLDLANGLTLYPADFEYSGQWFDQFCKVDVQYSYVNGFPIAYVNGQLAAGTQSITVDNVTGFVQNGVYTIPDSANSEDVTVSSISGNTLTLAAPTKYAHTISGLTLSGVPQDIRDAVGIIVSNIVTRGVDGATTTKDKDFELQYKSDSVITDDVARLLQPYQVNR